MNLFNTPGEAYTYIKDTCQKKIDRCMQEVAKYQDIQSQAESKLSELQSNEQDHDISL